MKLTYDQKIFKDPFSPDQLKHLKGELMREAGYTGYQWEDVVECLKGWVFQNGLRQMEPAICTFDPRWDNNQRFIPLEFWINDSYPVDGVVTKDGTIEWNNPCHLYGLPAWEIVLDYTGCSRADRIVKNGYIYYPEKYMVFYTQEDGHRIVVSFKQEKKA